MVPVSNLRLHTTRFMHINSVLRMFFAKTKSTNKNEIYIHIHATENRISDSSLDFFCRPIMANLITPRHLLKLLHCNADRDRCNRTLDGKQNDVPSNVFIKTEN